MTNSLSSLIASSLLGIGMTLSLASAPAEAVTFGFNNITNNKAGDAAIGEAQLFVDVTETSNANEAFFTFINKGPAPSSITGVYFDDGTLLDLAQVIDSTGVNFSEGASPPRLPGGNDISPKFEVTQGFLADSNPPVQPNGVNPGEQLGVLFTLKSGKTFSDVINDLTGVNTGPKGEPALRIGIHVQGFSGGGSESFVNDTTPVPEPLTIIGSVAALGVGAHLKRKFTVKKESSKA